MKKALGVHCFTAPGFDTDRFGTFTGEVSRERDAVNALRMKCIQAMEFYKYDLAVASEGSFGVHPSLFFVPADEEWLIFIDKKNNLEIITRQISTSTNFHGEEVENESQLQALAHLVLFPSHALIMRKNRNSVEEIIKGISEWPILEKAFKDMIQKYGSAYVETDMRAMHNPTRMTVIESTCHQLIEKINTRCPSCNIPGYGISDVIKGLRCSQCLAATSLPLYYVYQCVKCFHSEERMASDAIPYANPAYCDFCNP